MPRIPKSPKLDEEEEIRTNRLRAKLAGRREDAQERIEVLEKLLSSQALNLDATREQAASLKRRMDFERYPLPHEQEVWTGCQPAHIASVSAFQWGCPLPTADCHQNVMREGTDTPSFGHEAGAAELPMDDMQKVERTAVTLDMIPVVLAARKELTLMSKNDLNNSEWEQLVHLEMKVVEMSASFHELEQKNSELERRLQKTNGFEEHVSCLEKQLDSAYHVVDQLDAAESHVHRLEEEVSEQARMLQKMNYVKEKAEDIEAGLVRATRIEKTVKELQEQAVSLHKQQSLERRSVQRVMALEQEVSEQARYLGKSQEKAVDLAAGMEGVTRIEETVKELQVLLQKQQSVKKMHALEQEVSQQARNWKRHDDEGISATHNSRGAEQWVIGAWEEEALAQARRVDRMTELEEQCVSLKEALDYAHDSIEEGALEQSKSLKKIKQLENHILSLQRQLIEVNDCNNQFDKAEKIETIVKQEVSELPHVMVAKVSSLEQAKQALPHGVIEKVSSLEQQLDDAENCIFNLNMQKDQLADRTKHLEEKSKQAPDVHSTMGQLKNSMRQWNLWSLEQEVNEQAKTLKQMKYVEEQNVSLQKQLLAAHHALDNFNVNARDTMAQLRTADRATSTFDQETSSYQALDLARMRQYEQETVFIEEHFALAHDAMEEKIAACDRKLEKMKDLEEQEEHLLEVNDIIGQFTSNCTNDMVGEFSTDSCSSERTILDLEQEVSAQARRASNLEQQVLDQARDLETIRQMQEGVTSMEEKASEQSTNLRHIIRIDEEPVTACDTRPAELSPSLSSLTKPSLHTTTCPQKSLAVSTHDVRAHSAACEAEIEESQAYFLEQELSALQCRYDLITCSLEQEVSRHSNNLATMKQLEEEVVAANNAACQHNQIAQHTSRQLSKAEQTIFAIEQEFYDQSIKLVSIRAGEEEAVALLDVHPSRRDLQNGTDLKKMKSTEEKERESVDRYHGTGQFNTHLSKWKDVELQQEISEQGVELERMKLAEQQTLQQEASQVISLEVRLTSAEKILSSFRQSEMTASVAELEVAEQARGLEEMKQIECLLEEKASFLEQRLLTAQDIVHQCHDQAGHDEKKISSLELEVHQMAEDVHRAQQRSLAFEQEASELARDLGMMTEIKDQANSSWLVEMQHQLREARGTQRELGMMTEIKDRADSSWFAEMQRQVLEAADLQAQLSASEAKANLLEEQVSEQALQFLEKQLVDAHTANVELCAMEKKVDAVENQERTRDVQKITELEQQTYALRQQVVDAHDVIDHLREKERRDFAIEQQISERARNSVEHIAALEKQLIGAHDAIRRLSLGQSCNLEGEVSVREEPHSGWQKEKGVAVLEERLAATLSLERMLHMEALEAHRSEAPGTFEWLCKRANEKPLPVISEESILIGQAIEPIIEGEDQRALPAPNDGASSSDAVQDAISMVQSSNSIDHNMNSKAANEHEVLSLIELEDSEPRASFDQKRGTWTPCIIAMGQSVAGAVTGEEEILAQIVGVKSVAELKVQQKFNLNGKHLVCLPNAFSQMDCLVEVHANSNQLAELPESLIHLAGLQILAVGNNNLQRLPEFHGEETHLRTLVLRHNQLTVLPESFGQFKSLEVLQLMKNSLNALPQSFCELRALRNLDLSSNQLFALPHDFGKLVKLRSLDLNSNFLSRLPETIGLLEDLQTLDARSNVLEELPKTFLRLKALQTLDLRSNRLRQLPGPLKEKLPELRSMRVEDNPLLEIIGSRSDTTICS